MSERTHRYRIAMVLAALLVFGMIVSGYMLNDRAIKETRSVIDALLNHAVTAAEFDPAPDGEGPDPRSCTLILTYADGTTVAVPVTPTTVCR